MIPIVLVDDELWVEYLRASENEPEDQRALGGSGSGNFGHVGRPGEVGGSSSSSSFTPNEEESRYIDNWAWPNAAPVGFGLSYERLRDPKTDEGREMTKILNKLPVHDGVTYRGISLSNPKDIERLMSAEDYELNLHSSASTDENTAMLFADAQSIGGKDQAIILEMQGRGRNIAHLLPEDLQDTKEVVVMAGTKFQIAGTSREIHDGLNYLRIKLKEVR